MKLQISPLLKKDTIDDIYKCEMYEKKVWRSNIRSENCSRCFENKYRRERITEIELLKAELEKEKLKIDLLKITIEKEKLKKDKIEQNNINFTL